MSTVLYFVQGERGGPIKIGQTARSVDSRIKTMQTGYPDKLVCLGTCPSFAHTELGLHHHLAEHRLHGEWFADCPQVQRAIDRMIHRPLADASKLSPEEAKDRRDSREERRDGPDNEGA